MAATALSYSSYCVCVWCCVFVFCVLCFVSCHCVCLCFVVSSVCLLMDLCGRQCSFLFIISLRFVFRFAAFSLFHLKMLSQIFINFLFCPHFFISSYITLCSKVVDFSKGKNVLHQNQLCQIYFDKETQKTYLCPLQLVLHYI